MIHYWLVKQEPSAYPFAQFLKDQTTCWDGVRNFQARKYLRSMQPGDPVLYYHSGEEKAVVGLAEVARKAYPDPTASEGDWSAVDLRAVSPFPSAVPLAAIKARPELGDLPLLRQARLSVMPITPQAFQIILQMGGLKTKH